MTQVVEQQPHFEALRTEPAYAHVDAQQVSPNRPPSATTSQISFAGQRDYGMKFVADVDGMASSTVLSQNRPDAQGPPASAPPSEVTAAAAAHEPPPYWERPRANADARRLEVEDDSDLQCHPFWQSWWDIMRGIGWIIAGALKVPLTFLHGVTKVFYTIPVLYKDESVREWPEITGFPTGCVAGVSGLWFGLYDGLTDWVTLPYKCARKEGVKGFFKGFAQGLFNIPLKPITGGLGFVSHPLFGIYKEGSKFKLTLKRESRSRKKVRSPV
ncbi:hypothetical protein F4779DRAFT_490149 [Xylariaceae sp. FL0662B]|nr:hypothetical protein F4779DRAFT_490149 [Xylariaceae sp. FL0662B]